MTKREAPYTKLGKHYEAEIEKATTIDELVWIDTDYKQDMNLAVGDLYKLCKISTEKRYNLEAAGQKYHRAKKPAWR